MRISVTQGQSSKYYKTLKDVSVSLSADVYASSMPDSNVEMTIETDDYIPVGAELTVWDEIPREGGMYGSSISRRISYAEVEEPNSVHVKTIGAADVFDQYTCQPLMATEMTAMEVINALMTETGLSVSVPSVEAASRLSNVTAGYLPEQSARERVLWMCLISGTFASSSDSRFVYITAKPSTATFIPEDETFWRPRISYDDYVTAITVTYYAYEERMPSRTEDYVEVGASVYVQQAETLTIRHPDLPEGTPEHVVEVSNVTAISVRNVGDVMIRLAEEHFARVRATLDVLNDQERYKVGMLVTALTGIGDQTITGYITDVTYSYGMRTRATLDLAGVSMGEAGRVEIRYWMDGMQVGSRSYRLPAGSAYEIPVPYLDVSFNGHRYILRPRTSVLTGTVPDDIAYHDVYTDVALDYHDGDLLVAGVDAAQMVETTLNVS